LVEEHIQQPGPEAPAAPSDTDPDLNRALHCPDCELLMGRFSYADESGIFLDICYSHGVWLDRGELEAISAWIAEKGPRYAPDRVTAQPQGNHGAVRARRPKGSARYGDTTAKIDAIVKAWSRAGCAPG
jgi:Zn-finger nucleic acid-binding protein